MKKKWGDCRDYATRVFNRQLIFPSENVTVLGAS